jgi:hypothetical protein
VLQEPQFALAGLFELGQARELGFQAANLAMRGGASLEPASMRSGADLVEHLQLGACQDQLAVLVLAIEGDQAPADVAQVSDRGGTPVEIGARLPIGADTAGKHQLLEIALAAHVLGKPAAELLTHALGHRESTLHIGLLGARSHDATARAPAHQ